jgi:hypothetical protein
MWMEIYDPAGGLGADRRPFNRTVALVTDFRLAGGVVRREATAKPMMQRIHGLLGSSLPRLEGVATGFVPLVAVLYPPSPRVKVWLHGGDIGAVIGHQRMKINSMIQPVNRQSTRARNKPASEWAMVG